jgi:ribose transport system permease protein
VRPAGFLTRAWGLIEPVAGLLLVILVFKLLSPGTPLTLDDVRMISVHTVITGIAALGMTLVIVSGGIDLSVGSALALASVVAALALEAGSSPWTAALYATAVGAACGAYNGLFVTWLRLPPFIATLGTLGFYRGLSKWIAGSSPVNAPPLGLERWVDPFPTPSWLGLAPAVWLMLALGALMAFVLRRTVIGRHAFAIGSNEATARLCGVAVGRTKVAIYAIAGLFTGLAGLFQFARLTQGDPTIAVGAELDVIAAVVIGGGSLSGGQGSVLGTLAGAFLMAFLRNRCTALGWPNFWQEMIVGHIIVVAVALDQWRARRRELAG